MKLESFVFVLIYSLTKEKMTTVAEQVKNLTSRQLELFELDAPRPELQLMIDFELAVLREELGPIARRTLDESFAQLKEVAANLRRTRIERETKFRDLTFKILGLNANTTQDENQRFIEFLVARTDFASTKEAYDVFLSQ